MRSFLGVASAATGFILWDLHQIITALAGSALLEASIAWIITLLQPCIKQIS